MKIKLLQKKHNTKKTKTTGLDRLAIAIVREYCFDSPLETKMEEKQNMKDVYESINEILDDICTNTLPLASVRLNYVEWKEKKHCMTLGLYEINSINMRCKMEEEWYAQYLAEEHKWNQNIGTLKSVTGPRVG